MEECVKDNLHDAIGGLKDYRSALGKANDTMNDALGAISRLEHENKSLRDELERLKETNREAPQCLDADGVPIECGDVVYSVVGTKPYTVCSIEIEPGNPPTLVLEGVFGHVPCYQVTHRKPDSWEQLADDAVSCDPSGYVAEVLRLDTSLTTHDEDVEAMKWDIILRAKRLAGVCDE